MVTNKDDVCWIGLKGKCNIAKNPDLKEDLEFMLSESVGVAAGLFGAGYIGNVAESYSGRSGGVFGWMTNNLSKVITFYVIGQILEGGLANGIQKAMSGSVIIDTIIRFKKGFAAPNVNPFKCGSDIYTINKLLQDNIQDNIYMRNQLNNVLQRLANNIDSYQDISPRINNMNNATNNMNNATNNMNSATNNMNNATNNMNSATNNNAVVKSSCGCGAV